MATPALSDELCLEAVKAFEANGTKRAAAHSLGIPEATFTYRYITAQRRGLVGEFVGEVPATLEIKKVSKSFDKNGEQKGSSLHMSAQKSQAEKLEGFDVKGVSRLLDANGNITAQWEKLDRSKPAVESVIDQVKTAFSNIPKAPKLLNPVKTEKDLLALYPLADLHLGLLAWGRETDQDWDTTIALEKYKDCMNRVAQGTQNASEAIVLGGGDLTHTDGLKPLTPQSGNLLDADTRWPKMLESAIDLLVYQVELARQKHKKVTVRILPGNHDETTAIAITYALNAWYRNEKNVIVDKDPSLFFWQRFGKTFLGATHGHATKLTDMPLLMANRKADDWAASNYRYVHGFHIHHKNQFSWENGGVIGETHQSPASQDEYHFSKGYLSGRSMQSITYHREYGEYARAPRAML